MDEQRQLIVDQFTRQAIPFVECVARRYGDPPPADRKRPKIPGRG